ncbi:ANTAR domain-containing protein [Modestobacter lacusdianchii]
MPEPDESTPPLLTPEASAALEQLGTLTLRHHSMESVLQTVTDLATIALPGDIEASITVQSDGKRATVTSTGPLARDLDEIQYAQDQGPCLHAATYLELVEITDTRTEQRFAGYARRASQYGNLSSLSVPLSIDERRTGALNTYSRQASAFDAQSRAAAQIFAAYATVALANMHAYDDAASTAANLRYALESRAVIDQAKGILMERRRVTADQAFTVLTDISQHTNRKLRDIAEQLVHTGELPGLSR